MKKFTIILISLISLAACQKWSRPQAAGHIRCDVLSEVTRSFVSDTAFLADSGFSMMAWLDEEYYISDEETGPAGRYFGSAASPVDVTYKDDAWTIPGSPVWIARDSTRFWCWAPRKTAGIRQISSADLTLKDSLDFTYSMPATKAGEDADNQEDLLFAYNSYWYDNGRSEAVNLKFYHALCQINFIVWPVPEAQSASSAGSFRNDYEIVDIALHEVNRYGECRMRGTPYVDVPEQGSPAMEFRWSAQDSLTNYTQTYNVNFTAAESVLTEKGWEKKMYGANAHWMCLNSFFIIPQPIGQTTSLTVTFKKGTAEMTKSVPLKGVGTSSVDKQAVTSWAAGYRYTYRLSISGDIASEQSMSVTLEDWQKYDETMRF